MSTQDVIFTRGRVVSGVAVVVLVLAMGFSTTWWSAGEPIPGAPVKFDAASWADENYDSATTYITDNAIAVKDLSTGLAEDPEGTGEQYGTRDGSAPYTYAVTVTGTAGKAEGGLMPIEVPGLPKGTTVSVQVGPAINGTALRDASGEVKFNDFTNQLDYADAAIALNDTMKSTVLAEVDPASLQGKTITVVGASAPINPQLITITPVSIEAGS